MSSHDTHTDDLLSLVKELGELDFRRGELHAIIAWHLRLRDVAGQQAATSNADLRPKAKRWANNALQAAITRFLADHPDRTPRQVSEAMGTNYESTRQCMRALQDKGILIRTQGGHSYAIKS